MKKLLLKVAHLIERKYGNIPDIALGMEISFCGRVYCISEYRLDQDLYNPVGCKVQFTAIEGANNERNLF